MLHVESIKKIYAGYSNVYDVIFKQFFYPRQRHVIGTMNISPGDKVLDVGVGTGLSLPLYPSSCNVMGIDLSAEMLKKAKKKIDKYKLTHIDLMEMDASNLQFDDNTFDHVIATFVISVVPDPVKVIAEMKRVCKKTGKIVIVNHFQSSNKFVAKIEEFINPICCRIGWRSDLSLDELASNADLEINHKYKLKKFDLWKVVFAVNNKPC
ncbi:MAG: methyltransferase domain-containing protein [Nitrospinae bacterium]|nr:methyltransferase domain-containing protein [Nitrospinota bacterium]